MNAFEQFIQKFNQDKELQKKLADGIRDWQGEKSEQAVFEGVFVPAAKKEGFDISFADLTAFREKFTNDEGNIDDDELKQAAGGFWDDVDYGVNACTGVGLGFGLSGGTGCIVLGAGNVSVAACWGEGTKYDSAWSRR